MARAAVSLTDPTRAISRADDCLTWDRDGNLLIASSPPETPPPPRAADKPRSFFTAKSRALADRLNAPPIRERTLTSPRPRQRSPSPLRRSKPQSKEFVDRQQAAAARRRASPPVAAEAPTTTSTFWSFLSRQRESSKRHEERARLPDPECSFSPHHAAVAPKVPQAPPIFSEQRAAMISSAAKLARSKIKSEVIGPCTFRPERTESSQKAIAVAGSRKEAILRKAEAKRQKMCNDVTSARERAEKKAGKEERSPKPVKVPRYAWVEVFGKLMAHFYKRHVRQEAKDVGPEGGGANADDDK